MNPYSLSKATFDHLGIQCSAELFEAELKCLNAALQPFGIKEQHRIMPLVAALGDNAQKQDFWVTAVSQNGEVKGPVSPVHIAFKAKNRDQVDEFYKAGISAGGTDNGAPGIRKQYHPGYYAAFVRTPNGHGIEAVFHDPELMQDVQGTT